MALLFSNKVSSSFADKVISVSDKLGIDPNWLQFVMYNESAKSFSPSVTNPIGCVGLIQFCPDKSGLDYKTIGGKQYKLSDIKNMSDIEQLDLVYEYYKPYRSKLFSFVDLLLVTLYPVSVGVEDYKFPSKVVNQNPHYFKGVSGDTAGITKKLQALVYEQVPTEFYDSFFEKKNGETTIKTRNIELIRMDLI